MELRLSRTDRGRRFRINHIVPGSLETVETLMFDPEHWSRWGPLLTDVEYGPGRLQSGTEGRLQLLGCFWFSFRVIEVTERFWRWTVAGMVPPADGHRIESVDKGETLVSFELPLWAPFYLPVCYLALRNIRTACEK